MAKKIDFSKVPEGMIIISVIMFSVAYIAFLSAYQSFIWTQTSPQVNTLLLFAVGLIISAIASYTIAKGLLTLNPKARQAIIIITIAMALFSIYSIIQKVQVYASIFTLALCAIILNYLYSNHIKKLYK